MTHRLQWDEFRKRYHPDADHGHYWQRIADVSGEAVELLHPEHEVVMERIEPEV